jgi:hypothetical protein
MTAVMVAALGREMVGIKGDKVMAFRGTNSIGIAGINHFNSRNRLAAVFHQFHLLLSPYRSNAAPPSDHPPLSNSSPSSPFRKSAI